mgnify:CR=1 FL=1
MRRVKGGSLSAFLSVEPARADRLLEFLLRHPEVIGPFGQQSAFVALDPAVDQRRVDHSRQPEHAGHPIGGLRRIQLAEERFVDPGCD